MTIRTPLEPEKISVPTPDPTTLTREVVQREVGQLRELVFARLEGIEKAVEVAHNNLVRVPTDMDKAIAHLKELLVSQMADRDLRYQQRFDAQTLALGAAMTAAEKAIGAALLGAEKAVSKAETANEARFAGVNEFRKTLSDQTASFIPRAEADARFISLSDKLDGIASRMDKRDGTGTGISSSWAILVSVIGISGTIIGAVVLLLKT